MFTTKLEIEFRQKLITVLEQIRNELAEASGNGGAYGELIDDEGMLKQIADQGEPYTTLVKEGEITSEDLEVSYTSKAERILAAAS